MDAPASEQPEINIFGPGYGESCLIHIGSNEWILIDSCLNEDRQPAALAYLRQIGVDVSHAVIAIVATHWHDDHIRGLAATLEACKGSRFATSAALSTREFQTMIAAYDENHGAVAGSGAKELNRVLEILRRRSPAKPIRALANRRLLHRQGHEIAHGADVEVWSLSPSDAQFQLFLDEIGNLVPRITRPKRRAPLQGRNHLSVAMLVKIGEASFLFGADLEEWGDGELGWSAIVASKDRPMGKSLFFKIPHHGSVTGHHDETWNDMLESDPVCVLTPWNKSRGLPTVEDIDRIQGLTSRAYSTSDLSRTKAPTRDYAVSKQIEDTTVSFGGYEPKGGHVRIRPPKDMRRAGWSVELFDNACSLAKLLSVVSDRR